jgi:hypothetical protein
LQPNTSLENKEADTQLVPESSAVLPSPSTHHFLQAKKKGRGYFLPSDLVPVNTGGHPLHLQGISQEPFLARSK